MKKLLLLTVLTGWFNNMYAQQAVQAKPLHQATDTSKNAGKEPVKIAAVTDANKASKSPAFYFKDLFESDALAVNANSGPKLNPRAVTFVEDYIDKYGTDLSKMKDWGKPFFNMMDGVLL